MYYRRTFSCNNDVIPAKAAGSTTPWYRNLGIAVAVITLLMLTGPGLVAQPIEGPGDGLTADERSTIQDEISRATQEAPGYRAILIVDSTAKNAIFGMYDLVRLTEPGWELLGRTIEWAIDYQDPVATRICLATALGIVGPEDLNSLAAYEYLVDSMGFNPDSIYVVAPSAIDTGDFTGFDLVFQIFTAARNAVNVLDQGVPFVTFSVEQAGMMGIGTGERAMNDFRDSFWIRDTDHEITSPWGPGQQDLQRNMWIDATHPSGNGVALVTADSGWYYLPAIIRIERIYGADLGSNVTVGVTLTRTPSWFDMGGFDLLVAYDTLALGVMSVSQGGLLDSCGWEYFEYRVGPEADCDGQPCPDGLIRLVGVADLATTPGSPSCYADTTGTLARITFRITSDSAFACTFQHIQFMWYDCSDNSLSSVSGDSLFVSHGVQDYMGIHRPLDTSFPTPWGALDTCPAESSAIFRRVAYRHGGFDIRCDDILDIRGDVNLNGVGFEIADLVLFENYFWNGLSVFTINVDHQVVTSEVNGDGVPLTLQDLTYMYYYIDGGPDVPHDPPDPGDTVFFSQDTVAKTVSLSYPDSLRAVFLVFEGVLDPAGEDSLGFDGQYTRVLLNTFHSWSDSTIFEQDSLFFYTGEATLVAAYAAFDGYTPIPTSIVGYAGDCCLHKGNVDNDPSGEVNIADLVYLVDYMFEDGPEPPCMREADVIEDWSIDIADLVFLVDYMFNGGPAALPCP